MSENIRERDLPQRTPAPTSFIRGVHAGASSLFAMDDVANGMLFDPAGTGSTARSIAAKLRDVVNVRDYGGDPGSPDNLTAFNAAFAAAREVQFGPGVWTISGRLLIPDGRTLRGQRGASVLKLAATAGSGVNAVVRLGDNATVVTCVLDGNLDARETAGFNEYVYGVEMLDSVRSVADDCHAQGVGSTDYSFTTFGGNGGGYLIESTESAIQHAERNLIRNCTADSERSGFIARIASPFNGYEEGELPYCAKNNTIENISGIGCNKNAVELVGPNTWGNTVAHCHVYDITGQGGFEADFGAHNNLFDDCTVEFSAGFVFARSFDGFSQRSSDLSDGKIKISHDNVFRDCSLVGGETAGAYYLRGFSEIGASRGARWVRPAMRDFVRGSGVGVDRIIGHYIEATLARFTGGVVEDPVFIDVDEGVRVIGASGYENLRLVGGYIQANQYGYRAAATTIEHGTLKVRGGVYNVYGLHFSFGKELVVDLDDVEFRGGVAGSAVLSVSSRPLSTIMLSRCDFTRIIAGSAPVVSAQPGPCFIRGRDNVYGDRPPGGLTDGSQGRVYNGGGDHVAALVLAAGRRVTAAGRAYGTTAPSAGTWFRDDRVERRDPNAGNGWGWRCTASGTFGTLAGSVTGTASAGSDQLTVSALSTIEIGQYIAIAGSGVTRHQVVGIAGSVLTIAPASTNAVSGAAVSYIAPAFEELVP